MQLVVVLAFLIAACNTGGRVSVILLALQSGATPFQTGALVALFSGLQVLFGIWLGRRIDRNGVRLPMLISACASLAALLLVFAAPPPVARPVRGGARRHDDVQHDRIGFGRGTAEP